MTLSPNSTSFEPRSKEKIYMTKNRLFFCESEDKKYRLVIDLEKVCAIEKTPKSIEIMFDNKSICFEMGIENIINEKKIKLNLK